MTIQDVKEYLKSHQQYYSERNATSIDDIKTNQRYYFKSDCGHEFLAFPKNVVCDNYVRCPVCSGRVVIKGINDFNTIHPELSRYLFDKSDGYKYTAQSNHKTKWKCPYCGHVWEQTFNKMVCKLNKCSNCGEHRSFSERVMSCLLDDLCVLYETEVIFDWSDNKRYDFYLPEYNTIIEMHGKQHYYESFPYEKARQLYDEEDNDAYKYNLAIHNNIENYIIINASKTDFNWIKKNICQSILPTILDFNPRDIDWHECNMRATSNLIYDVCNDYENGLRQSELIEKYGKSKNTIREYLHRGTEFGWCNYNPEESKRKGILKSTEWVTNNMSKPVLQIDTDTGKTINEFPSLQEAQRQLNISHIWDCIHGRRNMAGGYKWKYAETS